VGAQEERMNGFAEVRIDDNLIVYGTVGGPTFNTAVQVVDSGREYRNANWSLPLGQWDLGERRMMPDDHEALQNFFNARMGKAQGFRFKNWADYRDMGMGVLVAIPGQTGSYQMYKQYPSGGITGQRKISKPVDGTIKVYSGGVLTTATVDSTTGIVTGVTGANLTWTGQFDVPVRFDTDQLRAEFIGAVGPGGAANVTDVYFHLLSLPIIEIRL
jgi:uncharacterized protein (TIGR02217 family)